MALLINGELIDDSAIREESKLIRQQLQREFPDESEPDIDTKARDWAIDNVVERVLLRQAAHGFTEAMSPPSDAINPTEGAQTDWRLKAFINHLTQNLPRPTRREVSDFYRKSQMLFLTPECAHVSHIVKNVDERVSEAEAKAALEIAEAELRSGKPFAEVANEHSDCRGGGVDLGWFPRGQMVEEFEAVVFTMKPNGISPIFRSPFGFHIAQLHARKAAGVLPLREVYDMAEQLIMKRRRDEAVERFLDDVRSKSEIRRVSANSEVPA